MRSLYKISLAVLALAFLAVAGSAYAQDNKPTFTLTGDVGAAFGQFTFDKTGESPTGVGTATCGGTSATATCDRANAKAFTENATSWESNLRFTWAKDDFQVINRYRFRGSNEQSGPTSGNNGLAGSVIQSGTGFSSSANDIYIETWWTPGNFKLGIGKFQGQAWSQPFSGQYQILNPIPGSDIEYTFNWTGISGLDAEYNLGAVQVGVAVSSQCRPSCNAALANTTARQEVNGGSVVPHAAGKFGSISFRAQAPQTWGQYNNTANNTPITGKGADGTKAVSGAGYVVGVQWAQGALKVALDVGSFNEPRLKELQSSSTGSCTNALPVSPATFPTECKDRQRDLTSVRLDVPAGPGSAMLAYASLADNNYGNNTYTTTETTVRYYYPTSFGNLIPEYRATTVGGGMALAANAPTTANALNTKQKDTNNSEFRLIIQGAF